MAIKLIQIPLSNEDLKTLADLGYAIIDQLQKNTEVLVAEAPDYVERNGHPIDDLPRQDLED